MRQLLAMMLGTMMVVGLVALLGCSPPCKLTPDPDCDWTKVDHHCMYLCADNGMSPSALSADEGPADSGILDGGADG